LVILPVPFPPHKGNGRHALGACPSPPRARRSGPKRSMGMGKKVVVFRSEAISRMVCR